MSRLRRHLLSTASHLAIHLHQVAWAWTERARKVGAAAETPPADHNETAQEREVSPNAAR
jgi:hypothetical protein